MSNASPFSIGQLATLAATLEVTIPKPGNVHRSADFEDTTLTDFLKCSIAIGPAMQGARTNSLGDTILRAIEATKAVVNSNTNLGIVLLIGPLSGVKEVTVESVAAHIQNSNSDDAFKIYQAITLAKPGGLGETDEHDVNASDRPSHIIDAMELAAGRDMIARQYTNGMRDVIEFVWPAIRRHLDAGHALTDSVIQTHLETMQAFPDSLIARKLGEAVALESSARAADAIKAGSIGSQDWLKAISDLDFWLRADGNRRNPGTTADLIAAAIFVGLRSGLIDIRNIK